MLEIFPPTTDRSIQPIDRADTYLLKEVSLWIEQSSIQTSSTSESTQKLLVVNDRYGALHQGLRNHIYWGVQDSYNSRRAIIHNCGTTVQTSLSETLDIANIPNLSQVTGVLIKVPKSADLFQLQLSILAEQLPEGTPLWAGGMVKYLPKSFFDLFSSYTSESVYTQAEGKARLYMGKLNRLPQHNQAELYKTVKHFSIPFQEEPLIYTAHPGVFSYKKADRGTALLLEHFPRIPDPSKVVDLGCGSGILLTAAYRVWPNAILIGTDDSALAIASTRNTAELHNFTPTLFHTNIAEAVPSDSTDLVLCNPPFHQEHRVSMDLGICFVEEAARILAPTGHLALVANKHLGYQKHLEKLFSQTKIIGQNSKFRVYLSRK